MRVEPNCIISTVTWLFESVWKLTIALMPGWEIDSTGNNERTRPFKRRRQDRKSQKNRKKKIKDYSATKGTNYWYTWHGWISGTLVKEPRWKSASTSVKFNSSARNQLSRGPGLWEGRGVGGIWLQGGIRELCEVTGSVAHLDGIIIPRYTQLWKCITLEMVAFVNFTSINFMF